MRCGANGLPIAADLGASGRSRVLMGWTPPRRHRCAKVEVLKSI